MFAVQELAETGHKLYFQYNWPPGKLSKILYVPRFILVYELVNRIWLVLDLTGLLGLLRIRVKV